MGMIGNIKESFTVAEDGTIKRSSDELDTAMLNIIRVGASKDDILAAYKARKKCYQLCKDKANRSDDMDYVETLQLDNFPNEFKKADYGKQYVIRRNLWLSLLIISTISIIVGVIMHIDNDPTNIEHYIGSWLYICGGAIFFISTIIYFKMISIARKIKQLINDRK